MTDAPGNAIMAARRRAGLTQAQLARRLGVTQTCLSYWEAGKRSPSVQDLCATASALGVTPASLLPDGITPDGPREIGRILAGLGTSTDVLAVTVDRDEVLIGHPSGWPYRLGAAKREEFSRLYFEATRQADEWTARNPEATDG